MPCRFSRVNGHANGRERAHWKLLRVFHEENPRFCGNAPRPPRSGHLAYRMLDTEDMRGDNVPQSMTRRFQTTRSREMANNTFDTSTEDRIRHRAYQLWEQDGSPEGHPDEYWDRAFRQI